MAKKFKKIKVSDKELIEQMVGSPDPEPEEDLLLPIMRGRENNGPQKLKVFLNFDTTEGAKASAAWKKVGFFPMSALVRNVAQMVQAGIVPAYGHLNGKLSVQMTPKIVEEAYASYREFVNSRPISRQEFGKTFFRTVNFLSSVEETTGDVLANARTLLDKAQKSFKANALRSEKLDYHRLMELVSQAEEEIRSASMTHLMRQIEDAGEAAGFTQEMVKKAISEVVSNKGRHHDERFYALKGLLNRLRESANGVEEAIASRRQHQQGDHNRRRQSGNGRQRFNNRWEQFRRH